MKKLITLIIIVSSIILFNSNVYSLDLSYDSSIYITYFSNSNRSTALSGYVYYYKRLSSGEHKIYTSDIIVDEDSYLLLDINYSNDSSDKIIVSNVESYVDIDLCSSWVVDGTVVKCTDTGISSSEITVPYAYAQNQDYELFVNFILGNKDDSSIKSNCFSYNDSFLCKLNAGVTYNQLNVNMFSYLNGALDMSHYYTLTFNPRPIIFKDISAEINNNINEVNTSINSSDVDSDGTSSSISNFGDMVEDNANVSNLIALPVTLFSRILDSLDDTCTSFSLGSLFGSELVLPCINMSDYLGTALWEVIDVLFSGLFIYMIGRKLVKIFNNFTNFKEGDVLE